MRRGEVWWVGEPSGAMRPYLVLTRQAAIPVLHSVIVVPATRTVRGIPTEVELDQSDGMPDACSLSLDSLTLVPKQLFKRWICTLDDVRVRAVCAALREAVEC
ncbi:MAG: type II toxin-antitoxin system PemK/MazF family toxin [Solirubrobacteraceae bacterium]